MKQQESIKYYDVNEVNVDAYENRFVGCVILTADNEILLQQRGEDWKMYPGYLAEFGGRIEKGETPDQALVRELHEELGAKVDFANVVKIGAVTEDVSAHRELVYVYFWHDIHGTITQCFEGEPRYFLSLADVFKHPKMIDSVRWLLQECGRRGLLS